MLKLIVIFALAIVYPGLSIPTRSTELCRYYLYRRSTGTTASEITADLAILNAADIDETVTTVILVHGHSGSAFTSLNPYIIKDVFTVEDVNIITVDWSSLSSGSYSASVIGVPFAANNLKNFITQLTLRDDPVPLESIHIVGFDLGAHVAGIAGRTLNQVGRITGLDPSGSQWGANSARLRASDAKYVEVIHTDGSGILANGVGTAIGTVDFFANGGGNQPGCLTHACSHNRAYELFAASFVNPSLVGYLCTSSLQMTLNTCRVNPLSIGTNTLWKAGYGTYRVNTGRSYPF